MKWKDPDELFLLQKNGAFGVERKREEKWGAFRIFSWGRSIGYRFIFCVFLFLWGLVVFFCFSFGFLWLCLPRRHRQHVNTLSLRSAARSEAC